MPLTLTYFNGKGRAELSRLILAVGGVEYVDQRLGVDGVPAWPAQKEEQPFGQLPVLTFEDGTKIGQSVAIALYLAQKSPLNLLGDSLEEQARTTSVFLQVNEAFETFGNFWFSTPEAERAEKALAEVTEGATSKALAALKKYLDTVETDFVFGDSITLADLAIFNLRDQLAKFPDEVFPAKVVAIAAKVKQNEKLAAYLEQRPVTPW
ncbi:MAG: hypothetical protein MHM6MM_001055 [Cercozoa sp. M6MM]